MGEEEGRYMRTGGQGLRIQTPQDGQGSGRRSRPSEGGIYLRNGRGSIEPRRDHPQESKGELATPKAEKGGQLDG